MKVITRYWSDILNKEFKSEAELRQAEKEHNDKIEAKKLAEKEAESKKARIDAAEKAYKKASKEYEDAVRDYVGKDTFDRMMKLADSLTDGSFGIHKMTETEIDKFIESLFH